MSLNFVAEVWDALCTHIDINERKDAADTLVNLLIDNNYEVEEIKESFHGEREVLTALKDYQSEHDMSEEYDEDYFDDEDDYEDEW
jgi:hypothetical protein